MQKIYDIVAISSVCIDIQFMGDDALLETHGLKKGLSVPVTPEKLAAILAGQNIEKNSGGCGANIVNGIALHGGKAALIAKVGHDEDGVFLAHRIQKNGVSFTPVVSTDGTAVTTSLAVITTPDRERTFAYPENAAGYHLTPEDVDENLIKSAKILYLDSYLLLTNSGRATAEYAASIAKKNGTTVALAINNAELVSEKHAQFFHLATKYADIVLGDQKEILALFDRDSQGQALLCAGRAAFSYKLTASVTMGSKGAYIVTRENLKKIPAEAIDKEKIIDTNGAGDQFAAGFLYGTAQGKSLEESGRMGSAWAAAVIQQVGAEPKMPVQKPAAAGTAPKL